MSRWGGRRESNPAPPGTQPGTLPLSYGHHEGLQPPGLLRAEDGPQGCDRQAGLEPATSRMASWCSAHDELTAG